MRTIKFRAWNTSAKKMEYDCWITPLGQVIEPDGVEYNFPLMQFTGLHDKNGKEIYEGDLVRVKDWPHLEEIKYYKNGFYLDDGIWSNWSGEDIEVIGNIYENPKLLTH